MNASKHLLRHTEDIELASEINCPLVDENNYHDSKKLRITIVDEMNKKL